MNEEQVTTPGSPFSKGDLGGFLEGVDEGRLFTDKSAYFIIPHTPFTKGGFGIYRISFMAVFGMRWGCTGIRCIGPTDPILRKGFYESSRTVYRNAPVWFPG